MDVHGPWGRRSGYFSSKALSKKSLLISNEVTTFCRAGLIGMAIRGLLVTMVGAALLSLGGAASDPAPTNEPWLELPQANQRVAIDSSVALGAAPSSVQQIV